MQRADIIIGEEYGLRENRQRGGRLQRVRIVQHVRGNKWKAEWVEPNPGLIDYVDGRTLLVRWRENEAFIADETSETRLRRSATSSRVGSAFSVQVEVDLAGKTVAKKSTAGVPLTVIVKGDDFVAATVTRMYVRTRVDGELTVEVIDGLDQIKAYLAKIGAHP